MGRAQWRKSRCTRSGMERIGRGPSQRPCFRPHPEFRRRGCRPQATERARRMAARSCRQVQSRRAANPRPPARALRRQALVLAGSLLTNGFPHLCIDPDKLAAKGVDFETAATAQGFMEHGEPIGFEAMSKLHFCVVGCVAVTRSGRTGKGAGFADLEQGVIRELGLVSSSMPITRTVQPPRSWPIPRWSWKAITRLWIISRRNSS